MWSVGGSANCWYPLTCSDGVWDPEKWHASLYPASGRNSPVEGLKKELDPDRPSLVRRIVGERVKVGAPVLEQQVCLPLIEFLAESFMHSGKMSLSGN